MNKHKHLDYIQNVITRMNTNSFLIKAWCITIISALFVLSKDDTNSKFLLFSLIPCFSFWILDGFFISTERKYRELYKHVISLNEKNINYSMDTKPFRKLNNYWISGIISKTLIPFYGFIIIGILIIYKYLR